ncbi:trehalose phosphorylase protein [Rutstroemia sp. NJR-2017a BBW]|nr:trehalose phosphorylase protein [Rutstroemia sp. NJR-2017a BBW]
MLQPAFLGIAAFVRGDGGVDAAFVSHDGTYSIDFAVEKLRNQKQKHSPAGNSGFEAGTDTASPASHISPEELSSLLADYFVSKIRDYEQGHYYKFVGVGMTRRVATLSPELPSRLWAELDIVPMIFEQSLDYQKLGGERVMVDEEADSMARKCLTYFGPTMQPRVMVGFRNEVQVDAGGHAQLTWLGSYQKSVRSERTWAACMKYVQSLKQRNVRIAFFSSTPQGGGVALMRHALIRFFRVVGVDCKWYVPKPKPEAFRITKTNHNILQGVADPKERLTEAQISILQEWLCQNAQRFWTCEGGPLRPRSEGGADVVIIDDPQMPDLVPLAKQYDPSRPVIFRSHIQIRADLVDKKDNPTADVWDWLWNKVKSADVFISHPVREFVPGDVPTQKVGYMPATTDWLDGLNKNMDTYNAQYYIHEFNSECQKQLVSRLAFPLRPYIIQIARFDPSKGIPHVLESYAELRRTYMKNKDLKDIPQLVIAGHGAVDDPDSSWIYYQTIEALEKKYEEIRSDVIVMRVGPTDQILNALLSNAKIALQLSTREGFEVKISEALHKFIPAIVTRVGGIGLQIADTKSGFLVEPGDVKTVARHLHSLLSDEEAYKTMSQYAGTHVSDEVGTVGNALCWAYLADTLSRGEEVLPNSQWINDMAMEKAGLPYVKGEGHLPREEMLDLTSPVNREST